MATNVSEYFKELSKTNKDVAIRYSEKIKVINDLDPYLINPKETGVELRFWPDISYPDIFTYLIHTKSSYSLEELKAYKSLESYKFFTSGFVRQLIVKHVNNHFVFLGKVKHSPSFDETPTQPWIISDEHGTILSGHCTCVAGLGEVCSHVGAILFFIEYAVRQREGPMTCTELLCQWKAPSDREVKYARVREIDLSSSKRKCLALESEQTPREVKKKVIPVPSAAEKEEIYAQLCTLNPKPVVLASIPSYSDHFIPKPLPTNCLISLFSDDHMKLCYKDLLELSKKTTISITEDEAIEIEKNTRNEAKSKLWFEFRAGRITASKFKAACNTKSALSSPSLVKSICYPEKYKFKTIATEWGCSHENVALKAYEKKLQHNHKSCNLTITRAGLMINSKYPYLGASPDALVSCECDKDQKGCVEIKCPYCVKGGSVADLTSKKNCLVQMGGALVLDKQHAYYYQCQAQIFICDKAFCDFVVWAEEGEIFMQRIEPDKNFWEANLAKATQFFQAAVMVELLGRFFTNSNRSGSSLQHTDDTPSHAQNPKKWCICDGKVSDDQRMIFCEATNCKIIWYHTKCLKIKRVPKGSWKCKTCRVK